MYIYEIQIEGKAQGRGLGKSLMHMVEVIAERLGLYGVMLTVFNQNIAARKMYSAMGYSTDESSPGLESGYQILSKLFQ